MADQQKLTLSVNKNLVNWAKSKNLNISSFLEIRLMEFRAQIETQGLKQSPSKKDSRGHEVTVAWQAPIMER